MKVKVKKVYYCDYCGKKRFVLRSMENHEKYCTANLNRLCRMCGNSPDYEKEVEKYENYIKQNIPDYMEYKDSVKKQLETLRDDIIDSAEGCPACTLTIIRHLIKILPLWATFFNFDYKKEVTEWWKEKNLKDSY